MAGIAETRQKMSGDSASVSNEAWETARRLLASALEMEPEEIADDAGMDQLQNWDSLAHMRLMMALETELGEPLSAEAILSIDGLKDIAAVVHATAAGACSRDLTA
jgi:acyl carrier protein